MHTQNRCKKKTTHKQHIFSESQTKITRTLKHTEKHITKIIITYTHKLTHTYIPKHILKQIYILNCRSTNTILRKTHAQAQISIQIYIDIKINTYKYALYIYVQKCTNKHTDKHKTNTFIDEDRFTYTKPHKGTHKHTQTNIHRHTKIHIHTINRKANILKQTQTHTDTNKQIQTDMHKHEYRYI